MVASDSAVVSDLTVAFDSAVASTSDGLTKEMMQESWNKQSDTNNVTLINEINDSLLNDEQTNKKTQKDDAIDNIQNVAESSENVATTYVEKIVSKSGNWLATKDKDGNVYYFHKITRFLYKIS